MNVRDYRGRTPYRLASWARNSTDFYRWPEAAERCWSSWAPTRGWASPPTCRNGSWPARRGEATGPAGGTTGGR